MKHPHAIAALAVLGCLLSLPSLAATRWEPLSLADQGMYYMDPQSIEQHGANKQLWTVLDYRTPQTNSEGQTYRSMRAQVQINCKARMARLMHMSYFSGGMLSGKEVQKQGMLRDWQEIEADSPMARIAHRVC